MPTFGSGGVGINYVPEGSGPTILGLLFDAHGSRRVIEDWSAPYHRVGGEVFYI